MRLTHTRLLVTRFDDCFEFYQSQLGLKPSFGGPGDVYSEFQAGDATIALFNRGMMAQAVGTTDLPVDTSSQDRVVLALLVENIDATYGEMRERGVNFLNEPHDQPAWGERLVHLRDPDGNLIELYHNIPMSE